MWEARSAAVKPGGGLLTSQQKTARVCRAVFGKWLKWKALSLELNQPAMTRSRLALRSFLDFKPTDCSTT